MVRTWTGTAAGGLMLAATCAAQTSSAPATSPAAPTTVPASQAAPGDFRALAAKLTPDLLQIPAISQSPSRVVIVLQSLDNKTEDMPGRDLSIYTAKLISLLNTGAANNRVSYVQPAPAVPAGEGRAPAAPPRIVPNYALRGELHSITLGDKTYYLLNLHLTELATGKQVWENSYELQNLN